MPGTADLPVEVDDRAAYLPGAEAIVCADLHFGRGADPSMALPVDDDAAIVDRIRELIERYSPAEVVVAGDVLHAFSAVPAPAERAVDALRETATDAAACLVLVAGNHDTLLPRLATTVDAHRLGDGTVVCHGDSEPAMIADRYVIGHDHPAIVIEGQRRPCFLWGPAAYRGADVLALPAFDPLAAGTRVGRLDPGSAQSPLLGRLGRFHPVVSDAAGDAYRFPPLADLREHL